MLQSFLFSLQVSLQSLCMFEVKMFYAAKGSCYENLCKRSELHDTRHLKMTPTKHLIPKLATCVFVSFLTKPSQYRDMGFDARAVVLKRTKAGLL